MLDFITKWILKPTFIFFYKKRKEKKNKQIEQDKQTWENIQNQVPRRCINSLKNFEVANRESYDDFWPELSGFANTLDNIEYKFENQRLNQLFSEFAKSNSDFGNHIANHTTPPYPKNSDYEKEFQSNKPLTQDTETAIITANELKQAVVDAYNALYQECQQL